MAHDQIARVRKVVDLLRVAPGSTVDLGQDCDAEFTADPPRGE
jgi:hypothetical protein